MKEKPIASFSLSCLSHLLILSFFLLFLTSPCTPLHSADSLSQSQTPSEPIQERLQRHIHWPADKTTPATVGYIAINSRTSQIDQSTWLYVKSALDHYKETKPAFIIVELNTPGGVIYSAQLISDALHEIDIQHGIPVIAYIDDWAMSAGAMIAYSCRFIAIAKDASMGAAEPVLAGAEGTLETASEKVNSAIRADFRSRAAYFDRNPLIAEAMVDKEMVVVIRDGKTIKLGKDEDILPTDTVLSRKGKLLTLDAQQLMELRVADILLEPVPLPAITAAEQNAGQWPATKVALFQNPYFKPHAETTKIDAYQMDWRMRFLAFIAAPAISSLIFMGLMIGVYMEMSHPGFGIPATLAMICLALIIISSYAFEAAGWLEIIFILLGLLLVGLELFVVPGFGLPGIIGLIMVVAGLFLLMLPNFGSVSFDSDSQTWNAAGQVFMERLSWFSVSLILALLIIALLAKYMVPRLGSYSKLVLKGEQDSSRGYVAGLTQADLPPVGAEGVATSTLRPSGKISIEDKLYDAVSVGGFIEKNTQVKVIQIDGFRLVVDEKRNTP